VSDNRINWRAVPGLTITIVRPACPSCGSRSFRGWGGMKFDDVDQQSDAARELVSS